MGQWLWCSWQSGRFWHQWRSRVWIQSIITVFLLKRRNKEKGARYEPLKAFYTLIMDWCHKPLLAGMPKWVLKVTIEKFGAVNHEFTHWQVNTEVIETSPDIWYDVNARHDHSSFYASQGFPKWKKLRRHNCNLIKLHLLLLILLIF